MARPARIGGGGRGRGFGGSGGFGGGSFGAAGFDLSLSPWVKRLLIANAVVFLAMLLAGREWSGWIVDTFGFSPADLLRHPWSPLTYMFVHGGFWHLFFNMVGVFFFGPPLERAWGSDFFIRYYLVAGLGGALFSLLLLPLPAIGAQQVVVGASGALFGLLLAFALRWPEAPIYIWGVLPVKAKWFVGFFGLVALWGTLGGGGGGVAHWAHLGGLATGYAYLRLDDRISIGLSRAKRSLRKLFVRQSATGKKGNGTGSVRIVPEDRPSRPGRRGPRGSGVTGDTLDRVDAILDKIREQGIDALTEEEREFLDEVSRKYQGSR